MRVLVCGDREWTDVDAIYKRLAQLASDTIIIHGACRGADKLAGSLAFGLGLTVEPYPANWARYKSGAGPIRNQQMLDTGIDLVIAFHSDLTKSRGSADMVRRAIEAGVEVEVCTS